MQIKGGLVLSLVALGACATSSPEPAQDGFFARLSSLCGQGAFAGQLVSSDAVDAVFAEARIVMGPAQCSEGRVEIPLAVGEDRSRIWQISRTSTGLRLKHDHTHKDGTKDVLTQYGGDSLASSTAQRHLFPVDAETRALFTQEGIEVSNQNTWAVEIMPGTAFAYEMSRPNRFFRLEFDLTEPVEAPPLPWAVEPVSDDH